MSSPVRLKKVWVTLLFLRKVWVKVWDAPTERSDHMHRVLKPFAIAPLVFLFLSGCHATGSKSTSLSVIYGITAGLALCLLIGYCCAVKKKDRWFLLLFASVLVVNIGYYALAVSQDLETALFANRIAYLGSVFLPLSMWMIILNITTIRFPKWLPGLLLGIGAVVFLIAASPGYLDIYYKEVYFERINGVSVLNKVYGPLHSLSLVYLLGYFAAMVTTIVHATVTDKVRSTVYAAILAAAVFVNIGVWMIEQLVRIDFEILSVSYIISECFLLGLLLFIAEQEKQKALLQQLSSGAAPDAGKTSEPADPEQLAVFLEGLTRLTPKEQQIYDCYVAGKSTAEIMEQLNIKENTLKFHNKNLYSKLGISSRRQLTQLHRQISTK